MAREWESLNAKAELARMHRDGHCHETMVWYHPLEDVVACSPTLEESYRRATTQEPITDGGFTRISRAGIPKRPLPNCQAGPTASSTPLLLDAQMPWGWAPLVGQARWLPPSEDCGSVATCPVQWRAVRKGGDPITDQEGTTRTPGWHPEENEA